jgi:uncharacterized membrane protein
MTNTTLSSDHGKAAALVVYVLYLLSIPSAGVLALAGVFVALVSREGASSLWRRHLDGQVHIFGVAFLWGVALFAASILGWILTLVLIGFPILWLIGIAYFVLMLWFTVKSVLGFIALLDNRAP